MKIVNEGKRIFSCCYINDDVNFSKMYNLIYNRKCNIDFSKMTSLDFIKYLNDKNFLIEISTKASLSDIISKLKLIILAIGIDLYLDEMKVLSEKELIFDHDTVDFIAYLDIISRIIRNEGFELVQIFPVEMNLNKIKYYLTIVEIEKLLDLNEIGYME